jgi:hypothetical protein
MFHEYIGTIDVILDAKTADKISGYVMAYIKLRQRYLDGKFRACCEDLTPKF